MADGGLLWRARLPNALLRAITVLAIDVGLLIGGIVVVETVFRLSQALVPACWCSRIERHDLPLCRSA